VTDRHDRLNRHIDGLLKDTSPPPYPVEDEEERAVLEMAARLRLLHPNAAVPRRRFQARMRRLLARSVNPPGGLPRRRLLLGGAAGLIAGFIAGLGTSLGVGRLESSGRWPLTGSLQPSALAGWVMAGHVEDVPAGGAFAFGTKGLSGYILRQGNEFSALSAICNHLGCHVQWQPGSKQFVCPCDDSSFDRSGNYLAEDYGAASPVALKPLTRLAVRIEGDVLYVKPV
jgi:cytochrome b6-f complex iron-sulfur subunit